MAVKRMDNVGIVMEDIDAAIEFFTELGLERHEQRVHGEELILPFTYDFVPWPDIEPALELSKEPSRFDSDFNGHGAQPVRLLCAARAVSAAAASR